MRTQLIRIVLQGLSLLPLRINHALGSFIGTCSWRLQSTERRVSEKNLALCYPGKTSHNLKLAKQSLRETGKSLTELGWIWYRPETSLRKKLIAIEGQELIKRARENQRGIIIISPHIGSWEMTILVLANLPNLLFMYRSPRMAALDPILREGRGRFGAEIVSLTAGGIKTVLQTLKRGGAIGILPDQEPDLANGTFAPFLGVPANTMNLVNRLANRSDAVLITVVVERLPKGQGYTIKFVEADPAIRSTDKLQAATALNREVERCVAQLPSQYLWSYKRFNLCDDGTRRDYRSGND